MNTPTAALAWEFWQRHRRRLIIIVVTVVGFICLYPKMCAVVGFNPDSSDAPGEFARLLSLDLNHPMPIRMFQVLYLMFLVGGPLLAMVLSLLCVVWMFTFTETDLATKNPMVFPVRLFTLPVSTSFLFWRITISGLISILGLWTLWKYGVHQPETFKIFQGCYVWLTLLVLAQAIVWSLAAWPFTRMLAVLTLLLLVLVLPSGSNVLESPLVMIPLFLLGTVLARLSLQKIRQGEWQGRIWSLWLSRFSHWITRAELRGSRQFSSPAQAQLWFEWRRSAARVCLITSTLALLTVASLAACSFFGYPLILANSIGFALLTTPLVIFGLFSISPTRSDLPFMFTRPLTSNAIVTSILQSTALSALLSWIMILVALAGLAWLNDDHSALQEISSLPARRVALVIGLIFLTWRSAVVNLSFVLTENRQVSQVPVWILTVLWLTGPGVFILVQNGVQFGWFWNHLSVWALTLIALKFLFTFQVYRTALKRRLLTPSTITRQLIIWILIVAALLATLIFLAKPDPDALIPACLGIILLVPLARTGLASFSLAWSRHASGGPTTRWSEFK